MKRILFVALSATLLAAGCQKTKIVNQINPNGEPMMTFTTGMGKLTKASGSSDAEGIGIDNLRAQDFRVWVYGVEDFPQTPGNDAEGYDHMLNLPVTYRANGEWSTDEQHFWPGQNKELKFFAVSADQEFMGESGEDATSPVVPNAQSESLVITDFVSTNGDYDTDLMVADFVQQDQTVKTVDLWFRHALTKVQFAFNTIPADDINVFVQKVVVKGLKSKGTLTVTYNEENNRPVYAWSHDTESVDFVDDWVTPVTDDSGFPENIDGEAPTEEDKQAMKITAIKDTQDAPNIFTTWLVLPQEVEDKQVEITYLMNERQFPVTFNLAYDALRQTTEKATWNDNQFVRYVITLAPNLISFNPQVGEWDDPNDLTTQN